jgi:cold shock CspA family protein
MSDREFGCVAFWNPERGFGFVKPDEAGMVVSVSE